jgi:transcriptional regulator with XRE-family HTH domain
MTTKQRKDRLTQDLKDREYRHAFVAAHLTNGRAFQIRALREQRQWSQKELAEKTDMKQTRISLLENPDYANVNIETLKRFAKAFDVGLIVRFVPFSDLVKWELNLSSDSLEVSSFDDEPYFKDEIEKQTTANGFLRAYYSEEAAKQTQPEGQANILQFSHRKPYQPNPYNFSMGGKHATAIS